MSKTDKSVKAGSAASSGDAAGVEVLDKRSWFGEIVDDHKSMKRFAVLGVVFGAGFLMATGVSAVNHSRPLTKVDAKIAEKIRAEFPQTEFVDFNQTEYGIIEAITSKNIIYFDQDARVAIVGELMDIEKKIPVTVERRRNIKSFMNIDGGGAQAAPGQEAGAARVAAAKPAPVAPSAPAAPSPIVDLASLPESNYIVHNKGAGEILYVVSDFSCSFCKKLHYELEGVTDIEIREIPVRFLRDDSAVFGAHALCADDPVQAAADIFSGVRSGIKTCEEGEAALQFNTTWASSNGLGGTPALITEDGRASSGYRELQRIRDFLAS